MNYLDFIILAAVIIGFILGFKDGFVRKLIGIIGFIIAVLAATSFSSGLGKIIEYQFGIEYYLAEIMGGVFIFAAIIVIFTILKRVIHPFDKVNNFINQLVGGIVGITQLLIFLSALFLLLNIFGFPDKSTKKASVFYSTTYSLIPASINYIKEYTPTSEDIIKDYINKKDTLQ